MKIIRTGCTRLVILIGKYAIKVPKIEYGWSFFLKGLLANLQEIKFSRMKDLRMCPIFFYIPGGWVIIIPRCKDLTREEFFTLDINYFHRIGLEFKEYEISVPVEHKMDSFGWYNNKIVALDYGN